MTKKYRVFGRDGHRQAISFGQSFYWDFSTEGNKRILSCACADRTGTNDFVDLTITCDSADACDKELDGQISDGIFENCGVGRVIEI